MQIYEYELVSSMLFAYGIYLIVKGEVVITIVSGQQGVNTLVDSKSPQKVHKEFKLNGLQTRIFALVIMLFSALLFLNFKGEIFLEI